MEDKWVEREKQIYLMLEGVAFLSKNIFQNHRSTFCVCETLILRDCQGYSKTETTAM